MKPFVWAVLTALIWGCVPIFEKLGLDKLPVWVGIFYRCLGVILGALVLFAFKFQEIKDALASAPVNILLVFIGGFLASFVGQVCFYFALKNGEASRVVPVAATYPLISFFLGIIFLSEKVTLAKVGGIFFVLLGIFFLK